MPRMPRKKEVQAWAEYLIETDQSVNDAVNKTSSIAMAGWLADNKYRIEARVMTINATAEFEASEVEFLSDEAVAEILDSPEASPNEPDEPQGESGPQRGERV